MQKKAKLFHRDWDSVLECKGIQWNLMKDKTLFITGGTGLIGSVLINILVYANQKLNLNLKLLVLVRNHERAEAVFSADVLKKIELVVSDVRAIKPIPMEIDYIIHAASQTSSKSFVQEPVETIITALDGTKAMLELAKANQVQGFLYLSTMEVYGYPETDEKIYENHATNLNPMEVRSSYPESKRMCENLCVCYSAEYGVPCKVIRLTQTFGPGVHYDDKRVFAEFARCVIEHRDIILNTKGETKRCYLYVDDAVKAVLTVLTAGAVGKAYNAANENTYCSIYEMAKLVAQQSTEVPISVVIKDREDVAKLGYAPVLKMNLATDALRELGWEASVDLEKAYQRMISYMKEHR